MAKSSAISLIKPYLSEQAIESVSKIIRSGRLVCGPTVEQFEHQLADYLGVPAVVCVSSGTAALHLALLAAGVKSGDEVIVPAYTFPATANVVEHIGAKPVFVDSLKGGVNIDANLIERAITSQTKAIMPVHAFGFPAAMNEILAIANERGIPIIEDAACALGSKYKGKLCGTFGDFAAFSFHPRKLLTTGEGGAIAIKKKGDEALLKSLRNHGNVGGQFCHAGFNYRMTEFQAALGISQIKYYDGYLAERRRNAETYRRLLKSVPAIAIETPDSNTIPNWQTILASVNGDIERDDLIRHLARNNIEATIGTYCVPLTPYYRQKYGYTPGNFPSAWEAYRNRISLPLYHGMSELEIEIVVDSIKNITANISPATLEVS